MIVFAFPGTGKTVMDRQYEQVIELEISEMKYDNSGVGHLSKEARKAVPRPIKTKDYRKVYVNQALSLHAKGKIVLVALNFLLPVLWGLWRQRDKDFQIYLPKHGLRKEYRRRYSDRGNNNRFIREVMWVWTPTILFFTLLSLLFPSYIGFLQAGEFLSDRLKAYLFETLDMRQREQVEPLGKVVPLVYK